MTKCLAFVSVLAMMLLVAGCVSDTANEKPPDDCGWKLPANFETMTRDEYESWLRNEMPYELSGCEVSEERMQIIFSTFEEDQAGTRRWKRQFDVNDAMVEQRSIRRTITADEFIHPAELLYMCDEVVGWREGLEGIMNYLDDYRKAEHGVVEQHQSLQELESETRKLLEWTDAVEIRCGVN